MDEIKNPDQSLGLKSGVGGVRTLVQTTIIQAFYMLSF